MSKGLEISFDIDFEEDIFRKPEDENDVNMIINAGEDIYDKAEQLHSFLKTYFDDTSKELTQDNAYFSYILQVPERISSCFVTGSCLVKNQSEKEIKHKNLKTAEIYLKILLLYLECPQTIDATRSIIQTSISVLHQAYSHCKDSETFYGEFFEDFTNELGSFYKNIQDIQKATLGKLDVLLNNDSYDKENDGVAIILVSNGIGQLCELVTTLEQNIALMFWKVFSKLISKYKDIVLEKIEVGVFILPLIFNIKEKVDLCIDCIKSKEQVIESEIKFCLVELSLLKKIIQIFSGHLKQNVITHLRNLTLQLFSLLFLSHSYIVTESKDLSVIRIVLKTVKHAIIPFFSDPLFYASTMHCRQNDISSDLQVPLILLKLTAIDCLKTYSEHSQLLQDKEVLFEIFSTLKENSPEDDLKLICLKIPASLIRDTNKETSELVTMYQHCYTCLVEYSKLLSSCPNTDILYDKSLLDIFTSSSDVISLLMSDVWMYYLRCGSINDVYNYCNNLAKLLKQEQDSKIEQFFIRILKLLPGDYKIRLFEENENLCSLLGYNKILSRPNLSGLGIPSPVTDCDKLVSVIEDDNKSAEKNLQNMVEKACAILGFCTSCFDNLSSIELLKCIEFASIMFKSDILEIHIAIVLFLRAFSSKALSKYDKEFDTLTSSIAQLLSDVMQSKNYIIRYEAFNLYFKLAESTPHPEIVKKTVMKCPSLVPSIKTYAEKIPSNGFLNEEAKYNLYQKQLAEYQRKNVYPQSFSDENKHFLSDLFT